MPESANRRADLYRQLAHTTVRPPERQRLMRLHPDWPICTVCDWPIDPAAGGDGTKHPNCDTNPRGPST